jgi:hypothetical protein
VQVKNNAGNTDSASNFTTCLQHIVFLRSYLHLNS